MIYLNRANTACFIGGQIKIHQPDSVCCGQIKTITVRGNELNIELSWMADGVGVRGPFPMRTVQRWVNNITLLKLSLDLASFDVAYQSMGRVRLSNQDTEQYAFLCPPNAPLLDPNQVADLSL